MAHAKILAVILLLSALSTGIEACHDDARLQSKAQVGHASPPSPEGRNVNSIAIPYHEPSQPAGHRNVSECLSIRLVLQGISGDGIAKGSLIATNACSMPMALLVDPVETYYRRTQSEFFVSATIIEPAYATLYIFKADLPISEDSFLGDGGLEVFGWPGVALLPIRSRVELKLIDKAKKLASLPPGTYGAILTTFAAPASLQESATNILDLDNDVKSFNQTHRTGRVEISSLASIVSSPISYFKIQPGERRPEARASRRKGR